MRSKPTKILRFVMFLGLLVLEMGLVVGFYILPQFQARNSPATHLEVETPLHDSLGTKVGVVAYFGLLAAGNLGLIVMVWGAFKELQTAE